MNKVSEKGTIEQKVKYIDIETTEDVEEMVEVLQNFFTFDQSDTHERNKLIETVLGKYKDEPISSYLNSIIEEIVDNIVALENYEHFSYQILDTDFAEGYLLLIAYVKTNENLG